MLLVVPFTAFTICDTSSGRLSMVFSKMKVEAEIPQLFYKWPVDDIYSQTHSTVATQQSF